MTGGGGVTVIGVEAVFATGPDVYISLPVGVSVTFKIGPGVDLGAAIWGASSACIPFEHPFTSPRMEAFKYQKLQ
jgi:hypothetical protein